jgi:hypothetical protein
MRTPPEATSIKSTRSNVELILEKGKYNLVFANERDIESNTGESTR